MKILDNLQAIVTVGYIILVLIGIVFSGTKYFQFGVNIFSYSDALDFLIAPFKDLEIIIYTVVPLLFLYIVIRFDEIIKAKFPKFYSLLYMGQNKKSWFRNYLIFQWVVFLAFYIGGASLLYAKNFKHNFHLNPKHVVIEFQDKQLVTGNLIGTNPNFIFVQDSNDKTLVIPINSSVRSIQYANQDNSVDTENTQ